MSLVRIAAATACLALSAPLAAHAADQQLTAQQQRMKSCNAEASAKHLKGDERRGFMSGCLRGDSGGRQLTAQQQKMVDCNHTASERKLKGTERKSFMSDCLSATREPARSSAAGR